MFNVCSNLKLGPCKVRIIINDSWSMQGDSISDNKLPVESYLEKFPGQVSMNNSGNLNVPANLCFQTMGAPTANLLLKDSEQMTLFAGDSLEHASKDGLQTQDSFGKWISNVIADSPLTLDDTTLDSSMSTNQSFASPHMNIPQFSAAKKIFNITEISPSWALSSEETKVFFLIDHQYVFAVVLFRGMDN